MTYCRRIFSNSSISLGSLAALRRFFTATVAFSETIMLASMGICWRIRGAAGDSRVAAGDGRFAFPGGLTDCWMG